MLTTLKCERCGIEFVGRPDRRFCGHTCANQTRAEGATLWATYSCTRCGKEVTAKPGRAKRYRFCYDCRNFTKAQRLNANKPERQYVPCPICGKQFYKPPSSITQTCSKKCGGVLRRGVPCVRKPSTDMVSLGKGGFRDDIGMFVRSRWEANYVRYLNLKSLTFTYEPETFRIRLRDGTEHGYTPDFIVENKYYVEVKGWMREDRQQREILWAAITQLPLPIVVVDAEAYNALETEVSAIIPAWEHRWDSVPEQATRLCPICDGIITNPSRRAKYCSSQCAGVAKQKRNTRNCGICGTEFSFAPWETTKRFCSIACGNENKKKPKLTDRGTQSLLPI